MILWTEVVVGTREKLKTRVSCARSFFPTLPKRSISCKVIRLGLNNRETPFFLVFLVQILRNLLLRQVIPDLAFEPSRKLFQYFRSPKFVFGNWDVKIISDLILPRGKQRRVFSQICYLRLHFPALL